MKISSLRFDIHLSRCNNLTNPTSIPSLLNSIKAKPCLKHTFLCASQDLPTTVTSSPKQYLKSPAKTLEKPLILELTPKSRNPSKRESFEESSNGYSRFVLMGALSIGLVVLLMGVDADKALAFGPEGPLMEEFWDNVRRYALYALTVSTGAVYTVFQPIFELLKNPISAILILIIIGGSIYTVSQVLSAMVGFTDFTYDYGY